jgi:flagellar biogenesis protein FliO
MSNTFTLSSSKKLSSGAIAKIIIKAIIALALIALVIFLFVKNNRKYALKTEVPTTIDNSRKLPARDESLTDSESKKIVVAMSPILVLSEKSPAAPTSKNPNQDPSNGKIPVTSLHDAMYYQ